MPTHIFSETGSDYIVQASPMVFPVQKERTAKSGALKIFASMTVFLCGSLRPG